MLAVVIGHLYIHPDVLFVQNPVVIILSSIPLYLFEMNQMMQKGDQIINKGAVDAGLYLIVSGSVDVAVTGNIFVLLSSPTCSYMPSHGDKSQRYILDVVLESDSFGEELVLDPDTPCALEYYASK